MTWFFFRGLVRESAHWNGFLETFAQAFPGAKVVPLDLPGNGRRFREQSPISVAGMVEAMREEYLRERDPSGANFLFAISLGGMVGAEWMRLYPQDFQGAVLGNTSFRGLSPFFHRLRPGNYRTILSILFSSDVAFRERKILEITSRRPELVERWAGPWADIQYARPVSKKNALRQLLAALRFSPQKPKVPVLVLNGAEDSLVNPRCSQRLAESWGAPLRVHTSAGHDITLDAPDWVIEQVRGWLPPPQGFRHQSPS